jgi:hypothetical protein
VIHKRSDDTVIVTNTGKYIGKNMNRNIYAKRLNGLLHLHRETFATQGLVQTSR